MQVKAYRRKYPATGPYVREIAAALDRLPALPRESKCDSAVWRLYFGTSQTRPTTAPSR
jgi:hypothetical protein